MIKKYSAILICSVLIICMDAVASLAQQPDQSVSEENITMGENISRKIKLPTMSTKVEVITALPDAQQGAQIKGQPEFISTIIYPENGFITINISNDPVWIIEEDLPKTKKLSLEDSPFGFHPASFGKRDYQAAREIGVAWDRGGTYLMWVLVQKDLNKLSYDWQRYDNDFITLPEGMRTLKNITVCHDGMVEVTGRLKHRLNEDKKKKLSKLNISQYLEGTSYRPQDAEAYSLWVKAAVERYDGDGKNDMPGLKTAAKYWQVDNEPPRLREGYEDLVRITSKAIKEADPEAKVLVGGLVLPIGDQRQWTNYLRTQLPILKELNGESVDIIDFHWFGFAGEWKDLPEAMRRVREDLKDCGFINTPVWFTEMGTYSSQPAKLPHQKRELSFQSERLQASEMIKRYVVALNEGVKKIFWAWGMKEGFINLEDNDFFDNTGFIYDGIGPNDPGQGIKKIIYWTYQKMTQLLQYWDGSLPEKIKAQDGIFAYRFRYDKNYDRGIIAVWLDK